MCEVASWFASFQECALKSESFLPDRPAKQRTWLGPAPGELKLNVDAAWDADSGRASVGSVVQNHRGELIGVVASMLGRVDSVLTAECKAIWCGLHFVRAQGWRVSSVESDCLRATQLVNETQVNGLQGLIIAVVIALAKEVVSSEKCCWVPRLCNAAANSVAKARMNFLLSDIWSVSCPEWLVKLIQQDVSSLVVV